MGILVAGVNFRNAQLDAQECLAGSRRTGEGNPLFLSDMELCVSSKASSINFSIAKPAASTLPAATASKTSA